MKTKWIIIIIVIVSFATLAQSKHMMHDETIVEVDSSQFATIYFYRLPNFLGSIASFNVHVDGGTLFKMKNKTKFEVKVYKEGNVSFWVGREYGGCHVCEPYMPISYTSLEVEYGKKYYVEFGYSVEGGLGMIIRGIKIVSNEIGEQKSLEIAEYSDVMTNKENAILCERIKLAHKEKKQIVSGDFEKLPMNLIIDGETFNLNEIDNTEPKKIRDKGYFQDRNYAQFHYSNEYSSYKFQQDQGFSYWTLIEYSSTFCHID